MIYRCILMVRVAGSRCRKLRRMNHRSAHNHAEETVPVTGRSAVAQDEGAQLAEIKARFVKGSPRGEFVYRTLREAIVRGVLPEGRRVQDRALALELGVSRTPVRKRLCNGWKPRAFSRTPPDSA